MTLLIYGAGGIELVVYDMIMRNRSIIDQYHDIIFVGDFQEEGEFCGALGCGGGDDRDWLSRQCDQGQRGAQSFSRIPFISVMRSWAFWACCCPCSSWSYCWSRFRYSAAAGASVFYGLKKISPGCNIIPASAVY